MVPLQRRLTPAERARCCSKHLDKNRRYKVGTRTVRPSSSLDGCTACIDDTSQCGQGRGPPGLRELLEVEEVVVASEVEARRGRTDSSSGPS